MNGEVFVFDNIINLNYQTRIKELLVGEGTFNNLCLPWYFTLDITHSEELEGQGRCAFVHNFAHPDEGIISSFHPLFLKLIKNSCKKIKVEKVNILQGKTLFELPKSKVLNIPDDPHINFHEKHFSMIYYVSDSDGDTIIYNEKEKSKSYTIKERVSPKQGRVVLFDGALFHTDEEPKEGRRCIVRYDLVDLSVDSHI